MYIEELQWILERKFQKICLVTRVPRKVLLLVQVQLILLQKKLKSSSLKTHHLEKPNTNLQGRYHQLCKGSKTKMEGKH
ncbi:hypothetical protein GBA52_011601 [Prunus armeniaca]|nr:hypothetical protein GBA52_011601 [Prunus armeniaca]